MTKPLKKICGNCANACLINNPNTLQLDVIFCNYWVETNNITMGCTMFKTHLEAGYYYYHDTTKTTAFNKANYPIKND